jgi:tRNA 2-selenouridine synthase
MAKFTDITFNDSRDLPGAIYIDVRSPGEYRHDHVPGAVNIHLFDDHERAVVGTIYKHTGKNDAILKGTEFVGNRLKEIIGQFTRLGQGPFVIYCARGGMRSESVASLVATLGMEVYRVISGYKGYRKWVLDQLDKVTLKQPLYVLQGLTGSGKTEILRLMDYAIDLEGMAGHRSSIFGAMGLEQKSQKALESALVHRLKELEDAPYMIVEGESRKIGNLHIPDHFFSIMKESIPLLVETPMDQRITIIHDDYTRKIDKESTGRLIRSLSMKLGHETIDLLLSYLESDNYPPLIKILLERYYDPRYFYTIDKLTFLETFQYLSSQETADAIASFCQSEVDSK